MRYELLIIISELVFIRKRNEFFKTKPNVKYNDYFSNRNHFTAFKITIKIRMNILQVKF